MVTFVEDATANRGVASVERHEQVFEPMQPSYLLGDKGVVPKAEAQGAFLSTMYEECHHQMQAGFFLVRGMYKQSELDDIVIVVTIQLVQARRKAEEDHWDAAGELCCIVFTAVVSAGRPSKCQASSDPKV